MKQKSGIEEYHKRKGPSQIFLKHGFNLDMIDKGQKVYLSSVKDGATNEIAAYHAAILH